MSNTFPPELIAGLSLGAVWPVTMLVNLLKPLVEKIPGFSSSVAADKPAHDAAIQLLNGVASLGVTLVLAILGGYIQNPSQFWVMGVQIVGIMLAADFNYRGSAKSSSGIGASVPTAVNVALDGKQIASAFIPAMQVRNSGTPASVTTRLTVSPAQVADALNSAIQQGAPLAAPLITPPMQPATPQSMTLEYTSPVAAPGMPNAVKQLADDAVTQVTTQPALPAVSPAPVIP